VGGFCLPPDTWLIDGREQMCPQQQPNQLDQRDQVEHLSFFPNIDPPAD
jgi:hypothetical protein